MRFDKYVKAHAERLIKQLAEKWDDSLILELSNTLHDYCEVRTTSGHWVPLEKVKPTPVKVEAVKPVQLRKSEGNAVYERIFDIFMKESAAGNTTITVYPDDVNVSMEKLVALARVINTSNYKKVKHSNCMLHTTPRKDR